MPFAAKHPCNWPGCGELVEAAYCPLHARQRRHGADAQRKSSSARGYGHRWQKYREQYLRAHPFCVMECQAAGRVTLATVVDHIKPHKGDMILFWEPTNHQSGCETCHNRKTAMQDGGWGRPSNL